MLRLKELDRQVIVLTGATSGIGLVTARLAASRGARLVLVARNGSALGELAGEIRRGGGAALPVPADVGNEDDVRRVAQAAVESFGGFDTWVNNAGTGIYGDLLSVSTEDSRRMFDTNFWGVVYDSQAAARHFRERGTAGAILNVGSVLSDRAIPVQGMYCASKHAVKGFTDALRMELEAAGVPVSVTLIKPSSIDTPYPHHARNYLAQEPTLPPPVYSPDVVARAILYCAEHPERDLTVGGGGKALAVVSEIFPRLTDRVMESTMFDLQKTDRPARRDPAGALHAPARGMEERGDYRGHVFESSLFTAAAMHPWLAVAAAVGVGAVLATLIATSNNPHA